MSDDRIEIHERGSFSVVTFHGWQHPGRFPREIKVFCFLFAMAEASDRLTC